MGVSKELEPTHVAVDQADRALEPSVINTQLARIQAKAALILKTMIAKKKGQWEKLKASTRTLQHKLVPVLYHANHGGGKKAHAKARRILHNMKVLRIQQKLLHRTLSDMMALRARSLHQAHYALNMARAVSKQSSKRRVRRAYSSAGRVHVYSSGAASYGSAWTLERKIASTVHATEKHLFRSNNVAMHILRKGSRSLRRVFKNYQRRAHKKQTKKNSPHGLKKAAAKAASKALHPGLKASANAAKKANKKVKKVLKAVKKAKKKLKKKLNKKAKKVKAEAKKAAKKAKKLAHQAKKAAKEVKKAKKKVKKAKKAAKKAAKKVVKKKKAKLSKKGKAAFD